MVFARHWHESAMDLHVFPIWNPLSTSLPIPSLGVIPVQPELPVSCIRPGLAISFTYDNIHISMLFSQILPPSPSPTESKSLFFTSVSLFCLTCRVIITIFLNSIHMHYYIFLTYFTLYNRFQFYPPHWNWFKFIPFNSWVIFLGLQGDPTSPS